MRGTKKGFQKGARIKRKPTSGLGDPALVYQPKPRKRRVVDPLARLRKWEENNGGIQNP